MNSAKGFIKAIIGFILLFSMVNLFVIAYEQELTGDRIIAKVNELMNQETVKAKIKMTIVTTSGKKRTFVYDSFSKNRGGKNLIRYLEPRRVKGQAILMLNNADDIWAYFPRTKRVRKLATHAKRQKMEGSDFSYEDMGSGDIFIKDFNSKKLGLEKKEGRDCYKIEMTRKKGSDVGYSRLVMWVIKENFVPVVVDYYDRDNPEVLIKTLVQYDIKKIDGIPTGMKMVMYNKKDNTQTSMEIIEVKYNVDLEDDMFTERGLRK
ncbi:MAG: outer membrane lipoprotein-sorting protein [Candidatus Poribacteria bacterium]